MKKLLAFVLAVVVIIALGVNGCHKGSNHDEHPKSDHPKSDHPKSEHPTEHPKSD